jgi:hypothetical protein
MTIHKKLGFIFCRRNKKLLVLLKSIRNVLKMKLEKPLKHYVLIMAENIFPKSLKVFVMILALKGPTSNLHTIAEWCVRKEK